jgi:hypothetical protein
MKTILRLRRVMVGALIATMAIGALAPFAEAGHRKGRRYKGYTVERRVVVRPAYRTVVARRPVPYARYTVWRSNRGPVIAGFLGGLFLGATIANAAPAGYAYWDPYCHRSFASLDVYYSHSYGHHHDRVVHVIEVPDRCDWNDVHYCDRCDEQYWGDDHECDD